MVISQPIGIVEQASTLHAAYPSAAIRLLCPHSYLYEPNLPQPSWQEVFRTFSLRKSAESTTLMCDLNLHPSPMSREYWIRIFYNLGHRPLVFVKYPRLLYTKEKVLPHFNPDHTLCLYHTHDEWNPSMYLAETTVPWSSEWLYHYEIWKGTGEKEWFGGGV